MLRAILLMLGLLIAAPAFANPPGACASVAVPPGIKAVCSKAFSFSGTCGTQNYPGPDYPDVALLVNPWEQGSITILKTVVTVTMAHSPAADLHMGSAFVGSLYDPDPITAIEHLYAPNSTLATFRFESPTWPTGYGMQLPVPDGKTGENGWYIDLHTGACLPTGATYYGSMTVWYSLP